VKKFKFALFFYFSTQIYVIYTEWSSPGFSKSLCPRATQANTEHVEGWTSYVMWLSRGMLCQQIVVNLLFFHQWQNFFVGLSLETLDLANKLRILLLVAEISTAEMVSKDGLQWLWRHKSKLLPVWKILCTFYFVTMRLTFYAMCGGVTSWRNDYTN